MIRITNPRPVRRPSKGLPMLVRLVSILSAMLLAAAAWAQAEKDAPAAPPAAAPKAPAKAPAAKAPALKPITVNGRPIPKARVDFYVKQQSAQGMPDNEQTRRAVVDNLISQEVVAQEAEKKGF